jgi:acetyltransferase-like isoleucine patch superfamily enzyme
MKPLVIFGNSQMAQIAHFYLTHDSDYTVEAFTVDRDYISNSTFCNLPVVAFEEVENFYPPESFSMFIAVGYTRLNQLRTEKYELAKAKGYDLISYISSRATTWSDLSIGENCFILEDSTIQPFVKIGNNVTLWSGTVYLSIKGYKKPPSFSRLRIIDSRQVGFNCNHIGHHTIIGDNCFIAPHVVVAGGVEIGKNCFIGVNATIRDHVKIGENCIIGAGAVILKDTQPNEVYAVQHTLPLRVPSYRVKNI